MAVWTDDLIWNTGWNDAGTGKSKYSQENLFQCHFVLHKSHMKGWYRTRASVVRDVVH
jgi:hypothetical protein